MKRTIRKWISLALALVLSVSLLLSFVSCGDDDKKGTTPDVTTSPEDLAVPAVKSEKLAALAERISELDGFTFSGSFLAENVYSAYPALSSKTETALSGAILLSLFDPSFSLQMHVSEIYDGVTEPYSDAYLYMKDGTILGLQSYGGEDEATLERDVSEWLAGMMGEVSGEEVSSFGSAADAEIAELLAMLSVNREGVNAALAKTGASFTADDLLAFSESLVSLYRTVMKSLGHTSTVTVPAHTGNAAAVFSATLELSEAEGGGYHVTLSLDRFFSMLDSVLDMLPAYLNKTIAAILDELFGEGTSTSLLFALSSVNGDMKLSPVLTQIEAMLAEEGLTPGELYPVISSALAVTGRDLPPEEIASLVEQCAALSINELLAMLTDDPDFTMTSLVDIIRGYLMKTPNQIASAMAIDLTSHIAQAAELLAELRENIGFRLDILCDAYMGVRSVSLSAHLSTADDLDETGDAGTFTSNRRLELTFTAVKGLTVTPPPELAEKFK